jgi:hypothetical protein
MLVGTHAALPGMLIYADNNGTVLSFLNSKYQLPRAVLVLEIIIPMQMLLLTVNTSSPVS